MKRILIIANTYYQLICAIQMKLSIFEKDEVCLLLSDHSRNVDKVCERLGGEKIFYQVKYIKTKNLICGRSDWQRIGDFFNIVLGNKNRYSFYLNGIENENFDELICYNYNIDIIGLYSILYKRNREVKVSLYEEGLLSYSVRFDSNIHREIIKFFREIIGKKDISKAFNNFYCFYPKLYTGTLQAIAIPVISSESKCVDILKNIFDIGRIKLEYPQKYIYFSSLLDFEGGAPIGEYELVKKISGMVDRDNLMVKTHPRDTSDIFEKGGFIVDRNSSIPWEVIQMSGDFTDKVLMSAASSSVLAGSFMSEKPIRTFYMYKLCDISENYIAQDAAKKINSLLQEDSTKRILTNVKVVNTLDEIIS